MTTPLTPAEIAELRDIPVIGGTPYNVISTPRDQWERLVSIAEDHARRYVYGDRDGGHASDGVSEAERGDAPTPQGVGRQSAAPVTIDVLDDLINSGTLANIARRLDKPITVELGPVTLRALVAAIVGTHSKRLGNVDADVEFADPTPAVSEREGKGDTK